MKQKLFILLTLIFAHLSIGKRIELLRFNQVQTMPKGDFLPVYNAVTDFAATYNNQREKATNLILLEPIKHIAAKRAELRNFDPFSSNSETQTNDNEALDNEGNSELRHLQPLQESTSELRSSQPLSVLGTPQLQNYQALPFHAAQAPDLSKFQLSGLANTAQRNLRSATNDATSSGRTFKHFLLLRSLLGTGSGGSGGGSSGPGGYGGIMYPIIVNTPVNVANVNNNSLTNEPASGEKDDGSGDALFDGFRINYIGIPQTQPFQVPAQLYRQPTPVYQQRQEIASTQPTYALAMLNIPGTSSFLPFSMPQYQSPMNRNNADAERRHALSWSKNQSPWSAFANNLRGLQLL